MKVHFSDQSKFIIFGSNVLCLLPNWGKINPTCIKKCHGLGIHSAAGVWPLIKLMYMEELSDSYQTAIFIQNNEPSHTAEWVNLEAEN